MTDFVNSDDLESQAKALCGLQDFGSDSYKEPLRRWVLDLSGPHISEFGRKFLSRQIVKNLVARLSVVDYLKQNPGIEEAPLPPIIYVSGHERSGTTLLHNLLAQHPRARSFTRWELMSPVPPPERHSYRRDERAVAARKAMERLRGSGMEGIHWVDADEPDECPFGFIDLIGILGAAPGSLTPRVYDFWESEDLRPVLLNYRKVIQILLHKFPVPSGGYLVLKAPQLSGALGVVSEVFPEARFILTHRDPYRCLTSLCTLVDIAIRPFANDSNFVLEKQINEKDALGRMVSRLGRLMEFENTARRSGTPLHHIQYSELVRDPVQTCMSGLVASGFDTDQEHVAAASRFLEDQANGGRHPPRPNMPEFGYTRAELGEHLVLREYVRKYAVADEIERISGN